MSIDGPYGNSDIASRLAASDKAILISGGSGTGYLLSLLQSILQDPTSTAKVHVIIAVRYNDAARCIVDELERVFEFHKLDRKVHVDVHITDDPTSPQVADPNSDHDPEKTASRRADSVVPRHESIAVICGKGRPDLKELVRRCTMHAPIGTSVAITTCGPASMGLDVRNACAEAQGRILRGKGGAREVWLHCEAFGW